MKTTMIIFVPLVLLIASCEGRKQAGKESGAAQVNIEELKQSVIDVHDEIMPKMGELMSLKKEVADKIAQLEEGSSVENEELIRQLRTTEENLERSHDEMMQWMRQFKPDMDDMVQEEVVKYLENQKSKIKQVGELTNESIAKARELLKDE